MSWDYIHGVLVFVQHLVSVIGIIIIVSGVALALAKYCLYFVTGVLIEKGSIINAIRLQLGRTLVLGLEFIVAADLIGSTTTPDYYSVGLLAIIVLIRTFLSFSLNREIKALSHEK